jgi:protein-tyrosine phosphatase
MVRICFVCLGNICRSPTAEAVMKHLVREAGLQQAIRIESAGTGDWHVGQPRDRRSQATGAARGIPLSGKAQQFTAADFDRFDYVIAMDASNRDNLRTMAPGPAALSKISLLRSFDDAAASDADVPDPYYGGASGFDTVFDICQSACAALLARIRREHGL